MASLGPIASFPISALPGVTSTTFFAPGVGGITMGGALPTASYTVGFIPDAGGLTFGGAAPVFLLAVRQTWIGAEVLSSGLSYARQTWIGIEVLRDLTTLSLDDGFVYSFY